MVAHVRMSLLYTHTDQMLSITSCQMSSNICDFRVRLAVTLDDSVDLPYRRRDAQRHKRPQVDVHENHVHKDVSTGAVDRFRRFESRDEIGACSDPNHEDYHGDHHQDENNDAADFRAPAKVTTAHAKERSTAAAGGEESRDD